MSLANHGYINRDGRNVTQQDYINGFVNAFGFDPSVVTPGATNAINLCSQLTGTTCTSFNLDQLNTPHQIEHDASLTRLDAEMADNMNADNHDFSEDVFQETLDIIGNQDHIDIATANTMRLRRVDQAQSPTGDAPGWFQENAGGSLAEAGFYLTTMNDNPDRTNPQANLAHLSYWWRNERLPTDIGWVKPSQVIDQTYFNNVVNSVSAAPTNAPSSTTSSTSSTVAPTTTSSAVASSSATTSSSAGGTTASSVASGPTSTPTSAGASSVPSSTPAVVTPTPTPGSGGANIPNSLTTPGAITGPSASSSAKSAIASATSAEASPVVSSAAAKATSVAGGAGSNGGKPAPLPGYYQPIPPQQWQQVLDDCNTSVTKIRVIIIQLLKGGYAGATGNLGGGSYGSPGPSPGPGPAPAPAPGSGSSGSSGSGSGSAPGAPGYGSGSGNGPAPLGTKTVTVTATATASGCSCPS